MAKIITGKIETQDLGETITQALNELGVDSSNVEVIYVNPPGQHDTYQIGGDMQADPGAREASKGQAAGVAGGAAIGAVAGVAASVVAPVIAPVVVAGLTGVGAHVGGLVGAMKKMREPEEEQAAKEGPEAGSEALDTRRGGLMIAVKLNDHDEREIIDLLERNGATKLERAEGTWQEGRWMDFDPLSPPQFIEPSALPR